MPFMLSSFCLYWHVLFCFLFGPRPLGPMVRKNKYLHIYFCVALDCVVEIPMFTPMIVRVSFTCSQIYKLSVAILFCSERRLAKPGQTQRKKPKNLPAAPQGPPWGPPKAPRARGVRHPCPEDPPGPPQCPPKDRELDLHRRPNTQPMRRKTNIMGTIVLLSVTSSSEKRGAH